MAEANPKVVKRFRQHTVVCGWCGHAVRKNRSGGRSFYCSRQCGSRANGKVRSEIASLAAIARNWAMPPRAVLDRVAAEVNALRRIARYCERKVRRPCDGCALTLVRSGSGRRLCNLCQLDSKRAQKKKVRQSPIGRARKAIERATRRVSLRGRVEKIDPIAVFERDGWRCYLCGGETIKSLRGTPDPKAPELEHVVPLSRGGAHTWDNVRCACRSCNALKGDKLAA